MSEEKHRQEGNERDRAAARRDVNAGIRDRMAEDDMADSERDARRDAARDRMAAMHDRQAAARERTRAAPQDGDEPSETTDDD